MRKSRLPQFLLPLGVCFLLAAGLFAQNAPLENVKSQEVSEDDGVPVLAKHLPDWENVRNRAVYILNAEDLRRALGNRPVFEAIDFEVGTEAVTASYEGTGKLLIIEYLTPQASVDADRQIRQKLSAAAAAGENKGTFYRRIGNYNAFVFDGSSRQAADALLDQIKYEKEIQWLGENPFALRRAEEALKKAERDFVLQAADLFLATVVAIIGGLGLSVIIGIFVGIAFFYIREQKRAQMETYTDAGGMTRLNLDGFTPDTPLDRLLKE